RGAAHRCHLMVGGPPRGDDLAPAGGGSDPGDPPHRVAHRGRSAEPDARGGGQAPDPRVRAVRRGLDDLMRSRVYRYRVPWRKAPDPAYGPWREGYFVRIDGERGEGIGECAPLFERVPAEALIGWAAGSIPRESLPYAAQFAIESAFAPMQPVDREV